MRDPVTYHMIFQSKAMIYTMLAFSTISFVSYRYWTAPLLMRLHDVSATEVGMYIGLGNAVGGLLGVTLGGIFGDKFKQLYPAGGSGQPVRCLVPHLVYGWSIPTAVYGLCGGFCASCSAQHGTFRSTAATGITQDACSGWRLLYFDQYCFLPWDRT